MKIYRIKDWNEHFENDRSRSRKSCSFVCVPNKQHGMGFCRIMAEKDGAAIYGIWHLILGACSQQLSPRNGWLTADGDQAGSPWGVDDLALKFRRPETEISRALNVLSSKSVGWIEVTGESPDDHCEVTADSPPTPLERKKEGKEKKEGNEGVVDDPFTDEFGNEIPGPLRTPLFVSALRCWHQYKRERKETFKPTGAKMLLKKILNEFGNSEAAVKAIEASMASGWQGIYAPKNQTKTVATITTDSGIITVPDQMTMEEIDAYNDRKLAEAIKATKEAENENRKP
jgi:hypothetical protein